MLKLKQNCIYQADKMKATKQYEVIPSMSELDTESTKSVKWIV